MFQDFTLCINTKFVFGHDAETKVGEELAALGGVHTVLLHHDGGAYLTQLVDTIKASLKAVGIGFVEFVGVQPNPRLNTVRKAIDFARENKVDAVVAIGGGSAIDSGKAIALGVANDGDVWDFFTGKRKVEKTLPVAAVLTNPASGSESSQVTVVNNEDEHMKLLVSVPVIRPVLAFMNPALTASVPAFPTACGIVDMFSHICERYFTDNDDFGVIDRMAEGALRTLTQVGPQCLADLSNYEYRAQIMWTATVAQNNTLGIGREQDWSTHLLGNELSALYDTPHGATLSIMMGAWMNTACKKNPRRFARYAQEVFGLHDETMDAMVLARRGIEATQRFFVSLGMPISFDDYQVPTDGVEQMLDNIEFYGPDHTIGAVARLNRDDCRQIYRDAFHRADAASFWK
ncbi:iron-containing alcohol dehydrogenase [Bifidobacterium sp. ESL0690]|uniref:iron-containing alcohol dehydrogenase n=1 Tax=Bifidobacterium sp. ESL0690 TaxID=2983214 RepID=UPI0023F9076E|nr:iron-containing alcohol dehydrogenase [Bifidobacterium sp. ESL0690]WEV46329.1 iron-containing alcohol dehydrogenase [Bifidobacterium sp. ESL0690]